MMDLFLTWTSSSTLINPHLSTENLHTPTSMSAIIPVPPHPPRTVSSDLLQDELTSYAPPIPILADKSTSVYRKPTHTNLYVRYNSCAPSSSNSKDSVIRSLTRRAHILCSPNTYKKNWTQSTQPDRVKRIMDSVKQKLENPNKLTFKQFNRQLKATTSSLTASSLFHPTITKKIKKSLASHDVKITSSLRTTLRDLLTKTKTTPPPHLTPNAIYEISCNDCTATYNGQTNRPLIKRIKEHESHSRLHLYNPDDFSHNRSAPAHHSRTTGHKIA